MTTDSKVKMTPLREGMFEIPETLDGTPLLLGQRCTSCGEVFIGLEREFCANCCEPALVRTTLSTRGELFTYTVVHQQLRGALVEVPYVMARVRLPEGVTVQTILIDIEPNAVQIGMPVDICLRKLGEGEDGSILVNFFFRPAEG